MESSNATNSKTLLQNVYYFHIPLFVLDVVRMFQNHPKYKNGIKHCDLVEILQQESFSNGDLDSQIESAVRILENCGYLRYINNGYRTLGPFSRLAMAKTIKQKTTAWEKIEEKLYEK